MMSLKDYQVGGLIGPKGTGKTETVLSLSQVHHVYVSNDSAVYSRCLHTMQYAVRFIFDYFVVEVPFLFL